MEKLEMVELPLAPVLIIHSGGPIPNEAVFAANFAAENYSGPVVVIGGREWRSKGKFSYVDLESFYDPSEFNEFRLDLKLDPLHRSGVWHRAFERFFILAQYVSRYSEPRAWLIENDVLALDLNNVSSALDEFGRGIFAPMVRPEGVIASCVYVNDISVVERLTKFFTAHAGVENEMNLIGEFFSANRERCFPLPNDVNVNNPLVPRGPSSDLGIFDSAGVGSWLTGQGDSGNRLIRWNHHVPINSPLSPIGLRKGKASSFQLFLRFESSGWMPVRVLHIHSKLVSWFRNESSFRLLVALANLRRASPVGISSKHVSKLVINFLLHSGQRQKLIHSLPESLRTTLVDGIARLVENHGIRLSIRQKSVILDMAKQLQLGTPSQNRTESEREKGSLSLFTRGETSQSRQGDKFELGEHSPMNQVETDFKRAHAFFRKKWAERYPSTHLDEGLLWAGGCLYAALNSKRPLVIIGGPANARINYERAGQYVSAKRHFIFATNEAPGHGVRHAACYWDKYNLVGNWQFDANNLVLDPKVVELMFHNSVDEIFEWVKIGGETDGTFVSVAQSYGMFVLTFCRDRAKITRA